MCSMNRLFLLCVLLSPLQSLLAQTCQSDFPATTPTERFDVNNGTVYDKRTDLSWKRCLQGLSGTQCDQGTALSLNWEQALQAAAAETGWRLPNIKELQSIVERQCIAPALNTQVFPWGNASNVWSSSPYATKSGKQFEYYAWNVHFNYGNAYNAYRSNAFQVRLVRSGQ